MPAKLCCLLWIEQNKMLTLLLILKIECLNSRRTLTAIFVKKSFEEESSSSVFMFSAGFSDDVTAASSLSDIPEFLLHDRGVTNEFHIYLR